MMQRKRVINCKEAAEILKVSVRDLYAKVQRGDMPCFYIGVKLRFYITDLEMVKTTFLTTQ